MLERKHFGVGAQRHVGLRLAGIQKDLVQVGPVNDAVGKAVGRARQIPQRDAHHFLTGTYIVHAQPSWEKRHLAHQIGQAQPGKHAKDVRSELNASADFAKGRRLLKHRHRVTVTRQHQSRCQAADAAANNHDRKGKCHDKGYLDEGG